MADQVSNALSILSYFSSLLDPISTSTTIQKQNSEKYSSKSHDDSTVPTCLSPSILSMSSCLSPSISSMPPCLSPSISSMPTETPPLELDISNISPFSMQESFQPVMIGLKLPLSLACTGDLQTSSISPLNMSTSSVDHQAFFLINQVISPTIVGGQKDISMGPSASQNQTDGGHRVIFSESSWSLRTSPSSSGCSSKLSVESVKSENCFATKTSSNLEQTNLQIGSASSSPTWREGGEEVSFQFPCSTLSFSVPFTATNDVKQYLNNDLPQDNNNSMSAMDSIKSNKNGNSNSVPPANPAASFNHLHSTGSAAKEEKTCAVCGDRALGCNFDAISCESCKAFFRRNAFKDQKIKCLFDGNCQINVNTRRFCSFCRLKQCFTVGMKKDLILGVEEKRRRMEVVKQNRKRRTEECISSTTTVANSTSTPSTNGTTPPDIPSNESTNLLSLVKHDPLMSTSSSASSPPSIDSQLVRKLTAEESHMLIELNQVYDLSFTVDLEPLIHITQLNPSLNQLVNQSSYTVLRLIKFAKRLDDFVRLSQDLQISILKGCWFHLLLLRPVSLFDAERDGWITPKGVIPTDILKNATGYVQLHDDHVRYCRSIKNIIGNDVMLLVILLVLVLFAPDGPHVVAREVISNIQDRYVILLKHYLEAKYTFRRSAHMFPQLLEKIRELNSLVEDHGKILMDINPQEIEPIMLEMLDYKN